MIRIVCPAKIRSLWSKIIPVTVAPVINPIGFLMDRDRVSVLVHRKVASESDVFKFIDRHQF